jgi:hypothetical protein
MKACSSKKKMMKGGKTKSYSKGGKMEAHTMPDGTVMPGKTHKMAGGGKCRGYGAATRGMNISKKMG